jgi:hypothetical protein
LVKVQTAAIDQILAELIPERGKTLHSKNHELINCIWNKEKSPEQWKENTTVPVYKAGDKND